MDKTYDHKKCESEIYKLWEKSGAFTPKKDPQKEPYTIVLPLPNASGKMHTGNVLMIAIEDLLIRRKRMQGFSALWIPGTDHAGFETQITFEKKLNKEGRSRFDFDRQTLYQKIWDFVQENKSLIDDQIRIMGASVDWTRYKFSLDPEVVRTVLETFEKIHKDDLLYRDDYLVNYCPKCGTTFADLEVKHIERKDPLYAVRYQLLDQKDNEPKHITVATVRPETIFIDTHLAVNPKDKKNSWLEGRQAENPLTGQRMDIIADGFVDPEFGTGVVKITPAHDKADYEVAKKHKLPVVDILTMDGKINTEAAKYSELAGMVGLSVFEARKFILDKLDEKIDWEKTDKNYKHTVSVCYKGGHDIEPKVLPNWFIKVDLLKKSAHEAVKTGRVKIYPKWQEIKYHRWMESMQDWPISRQVVWGIRMPVWYNVKENPDIFVTFLDKNGIGTAGKVGVLLKGTTYTFEEIEAGLQTLIAPKNAKYEIPEDKKKPAGDFLQETDTFDTWFSSGQWPLVTLGYPNSPDFKYFYPTSVLETGWEILRLWVSRMIMFGIYLTGEPPFHDVYLHGMVRAIDGRKMSKSLGNVINPDEYLENYGVDALRMGLISGTANGKDFNFPHDKVLSYRNFANKLWNIGRFMLIMFEREGIDKYDELDDDLSQLSGKNKRMITRLNGLINAVNENLDKYRFAHAADDIYHFVWEDLASDYLESMKNEKDRKIPLSVLRHCYLTSLKLLHPFMPFVTEAIWQQMPKSKDESSLLITAKWPG